MPRQYLAEGLTGSVPFIVDRSKPLVFESGVKPDGTSYSRLPGLLSIVGEVNGNNRRYGKPIWEKNLQAGSLLSKSIERSEAFGLLEHPKDGIVTLQSPISHHVTKAQLIERKDVAGRAIFEVHGEIEIYETAEGEKLKALIERGYNPKVSSRGYGSLLKGSDGVDEVQEDYVCEGWDVVIKPSFEKAELTPNRSTSNAQLATPYQPNAQAESVVLKHGQQTNVAAQAQQVLKEESPQSGGASAPASAPKKENKVMDTKDIRTRITNLEALDVSRLDPQRFAESVAAVEELHQHIAESCTDAKQSWEATKLHTSLDRISAKLSESVQAPVKQARKLGENNNKLMKVIHAVAQTALAYKKKLGEALKQSATQHKLVEELTRRGQGWQRLAETRKAKYVQLEEDFETSTDALDIISKRYHEDTTQLARRVIQLEFVGKISAEQEKKLNEATRLRHVATIREQLEGKKPGTSVQEDDPDKEGGKHAGVGDPGEGEKAAISKKEGSKQEAGAGEKKGDCVAAAPGKITNEGKKEGEKAPVTETTSAAKIVLREPSDPRGLNESVEMVKRLSVATAK